MQVQTNVTYRDKYEFDHYTKDGLAQDCSMHIEIDPVTHIKEVFIYTNDGRGNGNLIFKFAVD